MTGIEFVEVVTNIALTLSFVVALVFGIAQVRSANRDRKDRLTLETLRVFQTQEFAGLILFITTKNLPTSVAEWQQLPDEDRVRVIQFGQEMESLGLLVAERLVDLDLVDKTLGSLVTTAWEKYKPVFLDMRQTTPDPFLGEYFQWLAESIEMRMREHPRKPFFQMPKAKA